MPPNAVGTKERASREEPPAKVHRGGIVACVARDARDACSAAVPHS